MISQYKNKIDFLMHTQQNDNIKKKQKNVHKDTEQHRFYYIAGENMKQYCHFERQIGSFLQN